MTHGERAAEGIARVIRGAAGAAEVSRLPATRKRPRRLQVTVKGQNNVVVLGGWSLMATLLARLFR